MQVDSFSLVGTLLAPFTFAAVMFAFVLVIAGVVAEREMKLRQALRTMGMLDSAFWLSWAMFENLLVSYFVLHGCPSGQRCPSELACQASKCSLTSSKVFVVSD